MELASVGIEPEQALEQRGRAEPARGGAAGGCGAERTVRVSGGEGPALLMVYLRAKREAGP